MALATIISLALPLAFRWILDAALDKGKSASIGALSAVLFALYVLRAISTFSGMYALRLLAERIAADLRVSVYSHLHKLGADYFAQQRIGDLTSRLTADTAAVRSATTELLTTAALQAFRIVGSAVIMVAMNWRLSLVLLGVTMFTSGASQLIGGRISSLARKVQDRYGDAAALAYEALSGILLVQAFARSSYEVDRYRVANTKLIQGTRGCQATSGTDPLTTSGIDPRGYIRRALCASYG